MSLFPQEKPILIRHSRVQMVGAYQLHTSQEAGIFDGLSRREKKKGLGGQNVLTTTVIKPN